MKVTRIRNQGVRKFFDVNPNYTGVVIVETDLRVVFAKNSDWHNSYGPSDISKFVTEKFLMHYDLDGFDIGNSRTQKNSIIYDQYMKEPE